MALYHRRWPTTGVGDGGPPHWRPVIVDADAPLPDVALLGATHVWAAVFTGGRPVGTLVVEAPEDPLPASVLEAAVSRELTWQLHRERLRARLVGARGAPPLPSSTVLVCTRDRPDDLRRCLASLGRLDPVPDEVLVVDNGSEPERTSAIVEEAGARYVREPLPGLDRARNRGIAEARGEVLLCTDDDVEVEPGWAGALLACFADPLVMAVGGLVLPARLDTPARWWFENHASFIRGLSRRVLDGSVDAPATAGSAGAGASMALRASFQRAVGGFPEELDAGMPTGSGGDSYAFYRVLRAGYRVVYEPAALARHTHRETEAALEHAHRGYGLGIASWATRTLVRDRDPQTSVLVSRWGGGYLARKVAGSLLGRQGALPLPIALAGLRGAAAGPGAYRAATRIAGSRPPVLRPDPAVTVLPRPERVAVDPLGAEEPVPRLSVVIPSRGRRTSLLRLLGALARQDYPADALEVVVALDGDLDGSAAAVAALSPPWPLRTVLLAPPGRSPHEGSGAGTARNRGAEAATGDLLLFLDDDVVPVADRALLAHARAHADGPAAAVGPCPPSQDRLEGPWQQQVRNWWVDQSRRLLAADELAFTDVLTGNLSLPRSLFEAVGGFEAMPRREDWELGYRLVRAGVPLRAAAGAAVLHEADLSLAGALDDRRREGAGDVAFARRHPEVLARLPLAALPEIGMKWRAYAEGAMAGAPAVRHRLAAARTALPLLERAGLHREFVRLLRLSQFLSYWSGVGPAVGGLDGWRDLLAAAHAAYAEPPRLDLGSATAMPELDGAGELQVTAGGLSIGTAPLFWGGLPFDADAFAETVVDRYAWLALQAEAYRAVRP